MSNIKITNYKEKLCSTGYIFKEWKDYPIKHEPPDYKVCFECGQIMERDFLAIHLLNHNISLFKN